MTAFEWKTFFCLESHIHLCSRHTSAIPAYVIKTCVTWHAISGARYWGFVSPKLHVSTYRNQQHCWWFHYIWLLLNHSDDHDDSSFHSFTFDLIWGSTPQWCATICLATSAAIGTDRDCCHSMRLSVRLTPVCPSCLSRTMTLLLFKDFRYWPKIWWGHVQ